MPAVKFILAQRKDLEKVIEQGGKPADVYYCGDTGYLYFIDREGIPVPLVELEDWKLGLKTEEGSEKIESKTEKDWYKDFPLLEGVFAHYGQD